MKLLPVICSVRLPLMGVVVLFAVGCGGGPETTVVSGTVTFDGDPLDEAFVVLSPTDGSQAVSLEISDGAFEGEVPLGKKKLTFYAMRPAKPDPRIPPGNLQNPNKNILPRRYSYASTMKLDVGSGEEVGLEFDFHSDEK